MGRSTNIPFASFDLVYGFSVIADFTLMSRVYVPAQFSTPTHLIGVTRDNSLMEKSSLVNQWAPIPGLCILDLVQLPDLSFVAAGMDNTLYACPSLKTCTQIPGSGYVKSIDVLPDKTTYIGVGMDNKLYTRAGMFASWNLIRNSGNVVDVTVLTNGAILGTTPERTLVYREKVDLKWKEVKNSCCVLRTAALLNGSFVGIGDDYVLYRRANLDAVWDYIPGTASVVSVVQISAMPVPKIILVGIRMDNKFWGKYSLLGVKLPKQRLLISFSYATVHL
ncbi:hypothetical protein HDU79_011311 [Rhizoclosmatium sp. JEL0117]|nr:hypothetical protein HDU79_011311 [Rhizoclosmatium sp. JEL0117]